MILFLALPASAQPELGRQLFETHCQMCHGETGMGDGPAAVALAVPPRDLTGRPYKNGCGPGAIVQTLRTGFPSSGMPSFSEALSQDELWALARYVRSLQSGCGCAGE